jgi:transporter family-2 protein
MVGAVTIGVLLAAQARVNGTLGVRLQDGVAAALISFGGGLIVLVVATLSVPTARRGVLRVVGAVRSRSGLRAWHCLGGVCGAYLVFSQSIAASVLGVALFTVAVVAGQVASGLVVDRLGLGPGGPQHVTVPRLLGAGLAVVAVVIAVWAELTGANPSWVVLLPALAGVGLAWQAAVNGRVKHTADSAITAATLNFSTGSVALVLAFAIELSVRGLPREPPAEPWLYIGGFLGIFVIGGATVLVHYTGVLVLSMGMIAGQLVGALLLDLLVPAAGTEVHTTTLLGIGLTLVAVGVACVPGSGGDRARPAGT